MHLFRDMQDAVSTDITQYPGYTQLSGDQQKKVAETYTNVYNNNQGKLGFRVAQGIAFETAKKMCESYVVEGSSLTAAARSNAWKATERARHTQTSADHLKAQKAHVAAAKLHDGAKAKEHRGQAATHASIAAANRKETPDKGFLSGVPWGVNEGQVARGSNTCNKKGCKNQGKEHVHPDDKLYPHGLSMSAMEKQYGMPDEYLHRKGMTEGDAEDFQDRNDAIVGMTEKMSTDAISNAFDTETRERERIKKLRQQEFDKAKKSKLKEDDCALIPSEDPEEDGAAKLLRMNHDAMCTNCNASHPADVPCYDGMGTHSMHATGGSGDILKQNHVSKGMKMEESDPMISAVSSYLTNRAKVTGLMESVLPGTGAGEIQKQNLAQKCPNCGATHGSKEECKDGQCEPETDVETSHEIDDANAILKKNHTAKGMKMEAEVDEDHIGFKALQGKLERSGKSKESAGAIAASIGKKKYGAKAMHKAAASHTPLGEDEEAMWAENYFPAKPLEEHCGHCSHPKSFHEEGGCGTCDECGGFTKEVKESEKKKTEICFCGHEYGHHTKGGCKSCKHEGIVTGGKSEHQFKKNDYSAKFEAEYAEIFAAQQGKINTTMANAAMNWLPESKEHGFHHIEHGDKVTITSPQGQQRSGTATMHNKAHGHWVLNMGGKYGTPGIADEKNFHSVRKAKKKADPMLAHLLTVREDEKELKQPAKPVVKKKKRSPSLASMYHTAMTDLGMKAYRGMDGKMRYENEEPEEEKYAPGNYAAESVSEAENIDKECFHVHQNNMHDKADALNKSVKNKKSVKEETDPLMAASLGYINQQVANAGGPINEATNAVHQELASHLKKNHGTVNDCLTTNYSKIPGLKVHASDTNGTSGIGTYKGHGVYWSHHHPTGEFKIEPHVRHK